MERSFDIYKETSEKVINLLIQENCSSLRDISIIYNIIMGFPYCINREGHYTYRGNFYNSIADLPYQALEQLSYQAERQYMNCKDKFSD